MKNMIVKRATRKVLALPEAARKKIGQKVSKRVDALASLRAEIKRRRRELKSGLGRRLVIDELLVELQEEYGAQEVGRDEI